MDHMCVARGIYGVARDASDYLMYQKYTTVQTDRQYENITFPHTRAVKINRLKYLAVGRKVKLEIS